MYLKTTIRYCLYFICISFLFPVVINSTKLIKKKYHLPNRIRRNVGQYDDNIETNDSDYFQSSEQFDNETRRSNANSNINNNINNNINTIDNSLVSPGNFIQFEHQNPPFESDISVDHYIDRNVLEKLRICDIFWENMIYIVGYLLRLPSSFLTIDEYISLKLIYNALKQKRVYLYNLLPLISEMPDKHIAVQFTEFINNIESNVPVYMKSAVEFWSMQLSENKIDQNIWMIMESKRELFDLSKGLSKKYIRSILNVEMQDEIKHYDLESEMTEKLMGPVYVKIFQQFSVYQVPLSQQLFGSILKDIPNEYLDPIFEEYTSFISEEMLTKIIPHWVHYNRPINTTNPYTLVSSVIEKIGADDVVALKIKKALLYIRDDLKTRKREAINYNNAENLNQITENGLNVDLLFNLAIPCQANDRVVRMKKHLGELLSNPNAEILVGLNRYKYNTPRDFLMALLARLQITLSPSERDTERIATIFLANLLFQHHSNGNLKPKTRPSFWLIIDIINTYEDSPISQSIDIILNTLMNDLYHWDLIETFIVPEIEPNIEPDYYILILLNNLRNYLVEKNIFPSLINNVDILINHVNEKLSINDQNQRLANIPPDRFQEQRDYPLNNKIPLKKPTPLVISSPMEPLVLPPVDPLMSTAPLNPNAAYAITNNQHPSKIKIKNLPKKIRQKHPLKRSHRFPLKFFKNELVPKILPALVKHALPLSFHLIKKFKEKSAMNSDLKDSVESLPPISALPANMSTLPPGVEPNECIIIFPDAKTSKILPPIFTSMDNLESYDNAMILPSMVSLHEKSNNYDILEHVAPECIHTLNKYVTKPLTVVFGKNYAESLLGKNYASRHPTRLSALISVIRSALKNPDIIGNSSILNNLSLALASLELISPYLFLPLMTRGQNFDEQIIWSTVSLADESINVLGRFPPEYKECGTVTMPLINPIYWLLPIDRNSDPFPTLMPQLSAYSQYSQYSTELEPLINVFRLTRIESLLGHDIKMKKFPNRGALFVWTLFKLLDVEEVKLNESLFNLIKKYWKVIQQPAACIKIPKDIILGEAREKHGEWTVDLIGLMKALPQPSDKSQKNMLMIIKKFLSRNNILEELNIPLPPKKMTRGEFLHEIFEAALISKNINIDVHTKIAIQYYKDKVLLKNSLSIGWVWRQIFPTVQIMIKDINNVHVGQLIENHLPYEKLSVEKKKVYNKLMDYFHDNPQYLELDKDSFIEKHQTTGKFVRELLEHLGKNQDIDEAMRRNIYLLIPEVIISEKGEEK